MIAELGQILLLFALGAALYQGVFPFIGAGAGDARLARSAAPAALVQLLLVGGAFAALTVLHASDDFSVRNVVENSHTAKPFIYKLSGVWGNHEGSMLLWSLILAGYGAAVASGARNRGEGSAALATKTLAVQGLIAAAFLAFIIFTSNPFDRMLPAPADGRDLNPLLQDPGLVIHPPFLYLGYVGFSIVFAYAAAGLLSNRIDREWARDVRPYALAAWVFMTIGIALGSWWAYYELGWGGFWAWDPVENASFMPWLAGTALIHSIRVLETRGAFKAWTALLAILAFSLSLVGTFLVRSGLLTSVHAFAVDPERGVFILAILAAAIGGSLTLFAWRGPTLRTAAQFEPVSREGGLLLNNLLLTVSCAVVFIGTFYPLFAEVTSGEKLSVGAPYFNLVFAPFVLLALLVMAPASALAWKRGRLNEALARFAPAAAAGLAAMVIAFFIAAPTSAIALAGTGLAAWTIGATLIDLARGVRFREPGALARFSALSSTRKGMALAHIGIAVVTLGAIGAGVWKSEEIAYALPGDMLSVAGYNVTLTGVTDLQGPNYVAERAAFAISKNGKPVREMTAERRFYPVRGMATTEAGIWTTLGGDLYIVTGERHPERGWVVRVWNRPLTVWMWIGSALMALGGIVALGARQKSPRKLQKPSSSPAPVGAEGTTS